MNDELNNLSVTDITGAEMREHRASENALRSSENYAKYMVVSNHHKREAAIEKLREILPQFTYDAEADRLVASAGGEIALSQFNYIKNAFKSVDLELKKNEEYTGNAKNGWSFKVAVEKFMSACAFCGVDAASIVPEDRLQKAREARPAPKIVTPDEVFDPAKHKNTFLKEVYLLNLARRAQFDALNPKAQIALDEKVKVGFATLGKYQYFITKDEQKEIIKPFINAYLDAKDDVERETLINQTSWVDIARERHQVNSKPYEPRNIVGQENDIDHGSRVKDLRSGELHFKNSNHKARRLEKNGKAEDFDGDDWHSSDFTRGNYR